MKKQLKILNVTITNEKKERVLELLRDRLKTPQKKTFIITPNPEMLVYASKHLAYQDKLNSADIALADGVGLAVAGRLLGQPIEERITGVDFIEELCKSASWRSEKPLSIGFLGGREGVAELAVNRLLAKYPYLDVVFVGSEWGEEGFKFKKKNREYRIGNRKEKNKLSILHSPFSIPRQIDILFVAYGVPKQEEWIYENLPKLPVKAAIGVGGAFDFLSGKVRRAPIWMQKLGIEWLFRLIIQPWRFRRQLALFTFLRLVLQEKFK